MSRKPATGSSRSQEKGSMGVGQIAPHSPVRKCIVSGALYPREKMLRFVVHDQGKSALLVPDVTNRLPGRGIWLYPTRDLLVKAMQQHAFHKAARNKRLCFPDDLAQLVTSQLHAQVESMLALANKSGCLLAGADKVEEALRVGRGALYLHAHDARGDVAKIVRIAEAENVALCAVLSREVLGKPLGREYIVHALVTHHAWAEKIMHAVHRYSGFC